MTDSAETKLTGAVNKVDRSIDRLKTCPLLLRVFCSKNRHHLPRSVSRSYLSALQRRLLSCLLENTNKDTRLRMSFKSIRGWMRRWVKLLN